MYDQGQSQSGTRVRTLRPKKTKDPLNRTHQLLSVLCSPSFPMAQAKPSPMCTEEAALPLPVLAPALFISSGQQAVRETAASWQPGHQSSGQGSGPHRMSPGWPLPHTLPAGAPPTCQGHCLPGPCCALTGRSLHARPRDRCWALLGPRSVRGDPGPECWPSRPGLGICLACTAGVLVVP